MAGLRSRQWRVIGSVCTALVVSGLLPGCRPPEKPIEQEQLLLSQLLRLPPDQLHFAGTAADEPAPRARMWVLGDSERRDERLGSVFTQFSQILTYTANLDGELGQERPFYMPPAPLTRETVPEAALQVSQRLWPRGADAPPPEIVDVSERRADPRDADSALIFTVKLLFPEAPRYSPRAAAVQFDAASGVCCTATAEFGKQKRR